MRYTSIAHMRKGARLTEFVTCDTPAKVGRKLLWPDKIVAPLPAGTLDRIEAVLVNGVQKTDFLREAVAAELKRRERRPKPKP